MRTIKRSTAFKRDLRRISTSPRYRSAVGVLQGLLEALAADTPLSPANKDHALSGNWIDYRDCHVRPDLVLIYRKIDDDVLYLARLGSHSNLFR